MRVRQGGGNPFEPLTRFVRDVRDGQQRQLDVLGLALERQIKLELSTPGKGRLYRRRRRGPVRTDGRDNRGRFLRRGARSGDFHRASAPGDPPAVDTGQLRNQITMERFGLRRRVGPTSEYAPPLEFGTIGDGGHIAARPFMRPALRKLEGDPPKVVRELTNVVSDLRGR